MQLVAYGDESGIHSGEYDCYGIGAVLVPADAVGDLSHALLSILESHGLQRELKWTAIRSHVVTRAASLACVEEVLRRGASFQIIVVSKRAYRLWAGDQEVAFYKSYWQLARHMAKEASVDLVIDDRSDRYPRRAEVLHLVANRALAKMQAGGTVKSVRKADSRSEPLLQVADLLVGAVTCDTNRYLRSAFEVHAAKVSFIENLAKLLGWDRLCYDTMPSNGRFNIWHFPREFTGVPGTRPVVLRAHIASPTQEATRPSLLA